MISFTLLGDIEPEIFAVKAGRLPPRLKRLYQLKNMQNERLAFPGIMHRGSIAGEVTGLGPGKARQF